MLFDPTRHNLFSKIADKMARQYNINWEGINDEEAEDLYDETVNAITFYEEILDEYKDEITVDEYQVIVTDMIQHYITISLLERREAIENLIKSI